MEVTMFFDSIKKNDNKIIYYKCERSVYSNIIIVKHTDICV